MLYTYPDNIGYVNNKKSISSVTISNGHIIYILGTEDDKTDTGKRLVIRTYGSYGTAAPKEAQTLVPILPYRVMINDKTLLNYSNRQAILKQNATDLNLYNPGIDFNVVDSTSGCWPAEFSASTRFIELNLTRKCFPVMGLPAGYSYDMQQTLGSAKLKIRPTKLEAYDIQASMVAESAGGSDNLYISVVSRVDMQGAYSQNNSTWNNFSWSWTVPIVIKLVVNRSTLDASLRGTLQEITPTAWWYPIASNWYDVSPRTQIGKINTAITSTPQTKLWNYNIIPCRGVNNTGTSLTGFTSNYPPSSTSFILPVSFGCIADICSKDSSTITCFTSNGNYFPSDSGYKQLHTINKITKSAIGFNLPSNGNSQESTLELSNRNVLCKTGSGAGDYYVSLIQFYDASRSGINVLIYDSSPFLVAQFKMFHVNDADLLEKGGSVYLLLVGDTERKIYKFPTANPTFINKLGKTSSTAMGNGGEKFLTDAGMTLVTSSSISPTTRTLIDFKPVGSLINYKLDTNVQDKSIDMRGIALGTSNHLKIIGSNCIAIDKITLSANGQTNKLEYWTL